MQRNLSLFDAVLRKKTYVGDAIHQKASQSLVLRRGGLVGVFVIDLQAPMSLSSSLSSDW